MILQFDPNQAYQRHAIQSVVDIFEGQPLNSGDFEITFEQQAGSLVFNEYGVGNNLTLDKEKILENVKIVQERNDIQKSLALAGMHFSVEMETGTGKTYVYLRTIYELNKKYGFKKFIIVVPGIAIREGVLKNLEITHEHLQHLYDKVPLTYNVYDSKNVSLLRGFASGNTIQVLVINIDSFAKDENVINKTNDRLTGMRPIEFIRHTNPIVIVDEPQNMETEIRKKAIESLNPLCTLRYSATHKHAYNLVYKLSPVKAYDLALVKQIEVDSVMSEQSFNQAYVKLVSIKTAKTKLTAKLEIDSNTEHGVEKKKVTVKNGDDLYEISNYREMYKDGFIVNEIDAENQLLTFSNGTQLHTGGQVGGYQDQVLKMQLRKTIEEHFAKELKLKEKGIKVLSLFFIDKVKNYRSYESGAITKGKFAEWFEELYNEISGKEAYKHLNAHPVEKVHNGYFAQDKKGVLKDSNENRSSQDDAEAYNLIMKDKERLLDINEPLRFIFSHSALKEGWDNPNVFQLCTLREMSSERERRQTIGRGLRLSVDQTGNRVMDKNINRLTVVANETFEDFARQLQKEIEDDTGEKFEGRIKDKNKTVAVKLKKGYQADEAFTALWDKIKQKTTYRVQFDTEELIKECSKKIRSMPAITAPRISVEKKGVAFEKTGISGSTNSSRYYEIEEQHPVVPDIIGYIQSKTELTRTTISRILNESERLPDCLKNAQLFLDSVVSEIKKVLARLMIEGIKYQKIANEWYELRLFEDEEVEACVDMLYIVRKQEKTLFNYVLIDSMSEPEKNFAKDCEDNEDVEFFLKLPRWFKINTPIGTYNPDWAVVFKEEKRLYFVAETKGSIDYQDLRSHEWQKILCGKKHFAEFPDVKFKHVEELRELG